MMAFVDLGRQYRKYKKEDEAVTASYFLMLGAKPVFAEIDPNARIDMIL
jgi:hypothetical protein